MILDFDAVNDGGFQAEVPLRPGIFARYSFLVPDFEDDEGGTYWTAISGPIGMMMFAGGLYVLWGSFFDPCFAVSEEFRLCDPSVGPDRAQVVGVSIAVVILFTVPLIAEISKRLDLSGGEGGLMKISATPHIVRVFVGDRVSFEAHPGDVEVGVGQNTLSFMRLSDNKKFKAKTNCSMLGLERIKEAMERLS